jgi:hypothetical protein
MGTFIPYFPEYSIEEIFSFNKRFLSAWAASIVVFFVHSFHLLISFLRCFGALLLHGTHERTLNKYLLCWHQQYILCI